MKFSKLIALAMLLGASITATAATDLIVNGSFEDPVFGHVVPDHQGETFSIINGWFSRTNGIEIDNNVYFMGANGHNVVELDTTQNSSMSQVVLGTQKNQAYSLTFALQDRPGVAAESQGIQVLWDGKIVGTYGAGYSAWTTEKLTVVGRGFGLDLLTFRAIGTSDSLGTFLDSVSLVSAVPEPETCAMLLAGLGLMGFVARRRKQS